MKRIRLKMKFLCVVCVHVITFILATTTYGLDLKPKIDPLADPLIKDGIAVGFMIGIVKDGQTQVIAYGETSKGSKVKPDADTVYEIGSISKVFTGILLADMVRKGIVKLDDPVQKYLPEGVKMPILDGKTITLEHLVTHTSGLPRMPDNFMPADPANPFADYSESQMYKFLEGHKLRRPPGQYEYSNYGMGLLGHFLARKMGKTYEQYKNGMTIGLAWHILPDGTRWHNGGTGGFHSWLGILPSQKTGVVILANTSNMQITQFGMKIMRVALGEDVEPPKSRKEIDLSTDILESYTGVYSLTPNFDINVTIEDGRLTVQATGQGKLPFYPESESRFFCKLLDAQITFVQGQNGKIDHLILHQGSIDQKAVRKGDVKERKVVEVSSDVIESYTGAYVIAPNVAMKISLENGKLMGNAPGMNSFQLFPESKTKFFMKEIPAKISFVPDKDGKVNHIIIHHPGGHDQKAVRRN